MPLKWTPITERAEFDDVEIIPVIDRILIWTLMPFVWIHGLIFGPSQVRRNQVFPRDLVMEPLTANDILPDVVEDFLVDSERAARALGFGEPRRFRRSDTAFLSVIVSASGEDLCLAHIGYTPRLLVMTGVAFQTRMSDGLLISTANHPSGTLTSPANVDAIAFADVQDLGELYELHRRRTVRAKWPGTAAVVAGWTPPAIDPAALLRQSAANSIAEAVRCGLLESSGNPQIRFTAKGARLLSWSSMWPWRQLSEWGEARRAARLRRELGA